MARLARELSENGLYYIVFRGVNRGHIFEETNDYEKLRDILNELKEEMKYQVYAYCFMSNHGHNLGTVPKLCLFIRNLRLLKKIY